MKLVSNVWRVVRIVLGGLLGIVMALGGLGWFCIFFLLILGSCNNIESAVIQCPAAIAWTLVCVVVGGLLGMVTYVTLPRDIVEAM